MHAAALCQNGLGEIQPAATCSDARADTHALETSALVAHRQVIFSSTSRAIVGALDLAPSCAPMAKARHAHGKDIQRARRNAGYANAAEFAAAVEAHHVTVARWESGRIYPDADNRLRIFRMTGLDLPDEPQLTPRVIVSGHTPRVGAGETPGSEEGSGLKDDPFGTIRWHWDALSRADQGEVLRQFTEIIASFVPGDETGHRVAARKRR